MLEAKVWLLDIQPMLSEPAINRTYVINMDQTPCLFSYAPNATLDMEQKKTVAVRGSGSGKTRCTISLTMCADGTKLKPMVIFKDEEHGPIATDKLHYS